MPTETDARVPEDESVPSTLWLSIKYGGLLALSASIWLKLVNTEVAGVYLVRSSSSSTTC